MLRPQTPVWNHQSAVGIARPAINYLNKCARLFVSAKPSLFSTKNLQSQQTLLVQVPIPQANPPFATPGRLCVPTRPIVARRRNSQYIHTSNVPDRLAQNRDCTDDTRKYCVIVDYAESRGFCDTSARLRYVVCLSSTSLEE